MRRVGGPETRAYDVIVDADAVGPGLTVRVSVPDVSGVIAYIAWDQLAFYDEMVTEL